MVENTDNGYSMVRVPFNRKKPLASRGLTLPANKLFCASITQGKNIFLQYLVVSDSQSNAYTAMMPLASQKETTVSVTPFTKELAHGFCSHAYRGVAFYCPKRALVTILERDGKFSSKKAYVALRRMVAAVLPHIPARTELTVDMCAKGRCTEMRDPKNGQTIRVLSNRAVPA